MKPSFKARAAAELLAATFLVGYVAPSSADEADFYRGKQVRVVIGADASSSYSPYARIITKHMTKHMPGNPTFVAEHMPGAGGKIAANWLYNVAAKDGAVIATFSQGIPVGQVQKEPGIQFDAAKFNWIGNPMIDPNITLSWTASGLLTLEDIKSKGGLFCGSTGGSTPLSTFPYILNNMVGTKISVIAGYSGNGEILLAMERGELNCVQYSWAATKSLAGHFLKDNRLNVVVQWGEEKNPEISAYAKRDVPLIMEYAKNDLDRKALRFIQASFNVGRPLVAPPGAPQARVNALRRAFDATMKDGEFLAEAAKADLVVKPIAGETLQKVVEDMIALPNDVVAHVNALLQGTEEKRK